jgi:hypothetical protein
MVTRRRFAQLAGFALSSICCLPLLQGCSPDTVAAFVTTIARYAAQLASYFGAGSLASQLTAVAGKIATDIASWQSGGAATDAIEAINDMIDLVNAIPVAGTYTVFIDLILGALSGLLALLPAPAAAVAATIAASHMQIAARRTMVPTPYKGFDRGSMSAANSGFEAAWARLQATIGPTVKQ